MSNPFARPDLSRLQLLALPLVSYDARQYGGKSIVYVFFTRHCGVGCPFCFFKSAPVKQSTTIADEFSDEGIDKYIDFANRANIGYLAISGGGEPLNHKKATLRSIAKIQCDRIVMNTSGSWAMSERAARRYVDELYGAFTQRKQPCHVVIRLSISEGHSTKLGIKPALNLIKIFRQSYRNHPFFQFQFHSFRGDNTLSNILEHFPDAEVIEESRSRISADEKVVKVMPGKAIIRFADGFEVVVGYTRMFTSGLRPSLADDEAFDKASTVFMEDLDKSEDFFPAVVENTDGAKGIDWAINYNGNICPWTNQVNDNQYNFYEDDFKTILHGTFSDPLMLSIIEKGTVYRDRITVEADPRAVRRMRGISLRDYSGTIIFEEEKTRLYFTLRVLQDYLQEGRINLEQRENIPKNLLELIEGTKEELLECFHEVQYTIIDQYKRQEPFDQVLWLDLFELIKLGHYELSEEQIQDAIGYYNAHTDGPAVESLDSIEHAQGNIERRLTERFMYIKPMACIEKSKPTASPELTMI